MVNSEVLFAKWLRTNVCPRVHIDRIPDNPVWPLVKLTMINGAPSESVEQSWLERPVFQLDIYGGTRTQMFTALSDLSSKIHQLKGTHAEGVVTGATIEARRSLPDTAYIPPRDRYVVSISLFVHP